MTKVKIGIVCTLGKDCKFLTSTEFVKVCVGAHTCEKYREGQQYSEVFETIRPKMYIDD